MAVTIPSDLVADVMRAADPSRLKTAVARLAVPQTVEDPGEPAFATVMAGLEPAPAAADGAGGEEAPARALDQLVWQNLYEVMLSPEESGSFGSGAGAGVWRSMAAGQLAAVSARAVDLALTPAVPAAPADAMGHGALAAAPGWPYFASPPIRSYAG